MRYSSSFAPQSSWRNTLSKEKEGREGREREGRSRESKSIFSSQDDDEGGIGGRDLPPPPPPPPPRARTFAEYFQTPATERSITASHYLVCIHCLLFTVHCLLLSIQYFKILRYCSVFLVLMSCHVMSCLSCHAITHQSIFIFFFLSDSLSPFLLFHLLTTHTSFHFLFQFSAT